MHRPDRLLVKVTGDNGSDELVYDGKTVTLAGFDKTKYGQMAAPNTIAAMLEEVVGQLGVDMPLADLLAPAPDQAFLSGVTTGSEVDTLTIDGAPYRHLFFTQPPGIELELWVSKNDQSLPARLIVTHRLLPGQPNLDATAFSRLTFLARTEPTASARTLSVDILDSTSINVRDSSALHFRSTVELGNDWKSFSLPLKDFGPTDGDASLRVNRAELSTIEFWIFSPEPFDFSIDDLGFSP